MSFFPQFWRYSCAALLVVLTVAPGFAQVPTVRVGIVVDGPAEPGAVFRASLESELKRLLSGRYEVLFPPAKQLAGDWTAATSHENVETLLADPDVDAVIVLGVVGPAYVTRRGDIPKTVVAAAVLDPETEGIPVEVRERPLLGRAGVERVRVSGVINLSYVAYNQDLERELETFREIAPFSQLTVLMLEGWLNELAGVLETLKQSLKESGVEATFVPVGRSVDEALAGLPAETEAVMLTAMPQLSGAAFEQLVEGLNRRKLPTYSLEGQRDVRRGVMAGLRLDRSKLSLIRRVALNLFNILQGESAAELSIDFGIDEQLTINIATARKVGVDPTFAQRTEAELVGETKSSPGRRISLSGVVQEAANVNLDLIAAERRVAAGYQLVREARSGLLPQTSISSLGSVFRGNGRQISGAVGLSQLIYSEQTRSVYDIERERQISREEQRFQLRLDTILQAAQGYLDVLRTKSVEDIEKSNLALTRSNLSIARARVDVGTAGRDEVLRWDSQIAQNRRRVIDASAARNRAEIALNRVLNHHLEEAFETAETGLDDPELTINFEMLRPFVQSPGSFRLFREFMAQEAFDGSPELRQIDASIRAQERALLATKRAFYVPTVSADAQLRTFRNSPSVPGGSPNADWTLGFNASLPLFQGGFLRAQKTRAQIELEQLETEREAAALIIEENIRSSLHLAGASFAGIDLAQEAAEAALENLDLVQDAYSEGFVDIVRVLDAQSQALSARLEAANAVFNHLIDLMATQRATGRFDYFRSSEERDALVGRLGTFFQERGYAARTH